MRYEFSLLFENFIQQLTSVRSVMCTPFAIVVVANVSLVTQGQVMNASKKVTRSKYRPSLNEEVYRGCTVISIKSIMESNFRLYMSYQKGV